VHLTKFCLIRYRNKENTKLISVGILDSMYFIITFTTVFTHFIETIVKNLKICSTLQLGETFYCFTQVTH
jgi:hypothetical protein